MNDYGTADDPILIPGALIAFRHFQGHQTLGDTLYGPEADWWYDSTESLKALFEWGRPEHLRAPKYVLTPMAVNDPAVYRKDHLDDEGWFTADCQLDRLFPHPITECRCGFYAHYTHQADFYPAKIWKGSIPVVYAAVEMSGTTVCGSKGVRAEKMRILAITPDWRKYIEEITNTRILPGIVHFKFSKPYGNTDRQQQVNRTVRNIASGLATPQHRIACYSDIEDLWKAYPESDRPWEDQ